MNKKVSFYLQLGFTLLLCLCIITPIILSALAGITTNYFIGIKSGFTLQWLVQVWELYSDSIFLSLKIAVACVIVTLILGVPAAYALHRFPSRFSGFAESLVMLPIAVPGLATGLALILAYGSVGFLRSSWVFILVGHVIFTLPFMISPVLALLRTGQMAGLEEAAASLGASFWKRFFQIVVPNCIGGIIAGAMMVLTLSIGEFNITWMLQTPFTKTLPVGLADSYASARLEIGSAYTLFFLLMIVPLLMLIQWIGSRLHVQNKGR